MVQTANVPAAAKHNDHIPGQHSNIKETKRTNIALYPVDHCQKVGNHLGKNPQKFRLKSIAQNPAKKEN